MAVTDRLILTRGHAFGMGTFGMLTGPGIECLTCERPWRGNRVSESCIPPGVYDMGLRRSTVVEETTGGDYLTGWEVKDVPGRSYIMFHPGNTIDDSEGCILPGRSLSAWEVKGKMRWAVTESRDTFERLMEQLGKRDHWVIEIRYFFPEYP